MSVLSFRKLIRPDAQRARDWSHQDIADFYRAYDLLRRHGVNIGIDRGLTDKGEPWLVFFDAASQDVFLHIARIDGRCILVSEALGLDFSARTIPDLIGRLDESVRGLVADRAARADNVVLHPAARIIMAVSAMFLLFKFDKGGVAYAKSEQAASLDSVLRKQEAGVQARLQASIGRLIEAVDTPAAIAATAGVLLTAELLRLVKQQDAREVAAHEQDAASPGDAVIAKLHGRDGQAGDAAQVAEAARDAAIADSAESVLPAADVTLAGEMAEIAAEIAHDMLKAVEGAIVGRAYAAERPEHARLVEEATLLPDSGAQAVAPGVPVKSSAESSGAGQKAAKPAGGFAEPNQGGAEAVVTRPPAEASTPAVAEEPEPEPVPLALWQGGEIVMDDLAALSHQAGHYRLTELSGRELSEILPGVRALLGAHEREIDGHGSVMLEQAGAASRAAGDIGLWQNVLADGTVLSVIGSADLFSGLDSLL